MRTKAEINALIATLVRLNAAILKRARDAGYGEPGDDDEVEDANYAAFNSNAQLLCALYWVMGQDTISQRDAPCPKCKGIGAPWNNSASVPCDDCGGSGLAKARGETDAG
jgi:hypothetical protein